ncbi:hypothetical protein AB5I41_09930 [Sphingomonas sp. MMS24-JH45]
MPRGVAPKFASAIARVAGADGEDEDGIRIERVPEGMPGPDSGGRRRGPAPRRHPQGQQRHR